ncbi:hypothetical protein GCM10009827_087260 [Dactylosporangium maewongense]|uniref:Uncharacterized protein n=1 Tax=Dactylosporangium maewongense TaxID=634393 RepID=A0ABP4N2A2_9ACTN
MAVRYRLATDFDEDALPMPDLLYAALDALPESDSHTATIAAGDVARRFIQVVMRPNGSLSVRFSEGADHSVETVDDVDILDVHQAILHCTAATPVVWRDVWGSVAGTFTRASNVDRWAAMDYAGTELSIATAMLDHGKRARRLGVPFDPPESVRWGEFEVITGDTWLDVPEHGVTTIRVIAPDTRHEHGVALRVPRGTINGQGAETVLWPSDAAVPFTVHYDSPQHLLQVSNVYKVTGTGWDRIDRWSGNAGMIVTRLPNGERSYACNHAGTTPPTFADLAFALAVEPR